MIGGGSHAQGSSSSRLVGLLGTGSTWDTVPYATKRGSRTLLYHVMANGRPRARRATRLRPGLALVRKASSILPEVDARLCREYGDVRRGSTPLGNKRNPLDELIYIQLSVRTRETTYLNTYPRLRRLVGGVWERLLAVPDRVVLEILEPGGMSRVKLDRLRSQLWSLALLFGHATLAPLRKMGDLEAETVLRSLPGVGPKVARCVLLYSLDRDVFPVDSNCRRVLARLGLVPAKVHLKAGHDFLQTLVPTPIRRSLHVNLIRHGRDRCLPGTPRCTGCPLLILCPTGERRLRMP